MYAIVSFDNEKETGFITLNCLVSPVATNNVGKLIEVEQFFSAIGHHGKIPPR